MNAAKLSELAKKTLLYFVYSDNPKYLQTFITQEETKNANKNYYRFYRVFSLSGDNLPLETTRADLQAFFTAFQTENPNISIAKPAFAFVYTQTGTDIYNLIPNPISLDANSCFEPLCIEAVLSKNPTNSGLQNVNRGPQNASRGVQNVANPSQSEQAAMGGAPKKCKKTAQKVKVGNVARVVYEGPRGGKYVTVKGIMVSLKKLKL